MKFFTWIIFFTFLISQNSFASGDANFPVEGSMRTRVDFWKKVYTEITSKEAFIHDSEDLSIIYKTVSLEDTSRKRRKESKVQKRKLKKIILSIAKKNYLKLTKEEKKIASIIGEQKQATLYSMAKNIRYQYGLKDRYYTGLIRSYRYLDYIKKTFKDLGLPPELVFLPHVESSFNYKAYSKVGAAGIWQFMRATARLYKLRVSYIIDERRDPLKATKAAARLLRDNYNQLKTWPLALTAYNHGARSLKRAQKKIGSSDINKIIKNYKGRRFGFASKNFYATFMATVEISKNPEKYFDTFEKPERFSYSSIKLEKNFTIKELSSHLEINKNVLKKYNPSIRRSAFKSHLYLPKNFVLKTPKTKTAKIKKYISTLRKIKSTIESFDSNRTHIVSHGENLFDISKIYQTNVSRIISFNQIQNPSRIYPGMKLNIPSKKNTVVKFKEKIKPQKIVAISEEKKAKSYKDTSKPGNYLSKLNTFFPPTLKKKKNYIAKNLVDKIPSPLVTLTSYHLELKKYSPNHYLITIETEETLSHIADWAGIKTQTIRNLNNINFKANIHLGNQLKVRIPEKNINRFKELRNKYHLSIQEDFYNSYSITSIGKYIVKSGDSLSFILKKRSLPFWLLRKSQKDGKLNPNLSIGQIFQMPTIKASGEESSLIPPNSGSDING